MLKPKQLLKLLTLALKIEYMLSLFPCPSPLLQLDLSVVTKRFNLLYEMYLSFRVFLSWFNALFKVSGTGPGEATGYGATSVPRSSQTGVETGTRNGWDLEKEGLGFPIAF